MKFSEIKKELKSKGIEVRKIRATLNGGVWLVNGYTAQSRWQLDTAE